MYLKIIATNNIRNFFGLCVMFICSSHIMVVPRKKRGTSEAQKAFVVLILFLIPH